MCRTCGRWVHPTEALHTDYAVFHDRITCLSDEDYETLIARYGCQCGGVPTITEWVEHLDEEHMEVPRVTKEERAEAIAVANLIPGRYDSDVLDRIAAERDRP